MASTTSSTLVPAPVREPAAAVDPAHRIRVAFRLHHVHRVRRSGRRPARSSLAIAPRLLEVFLRPWSGTRSIRLPSRGAARSRRPDCSSSSNRGDAWTWRSAAAWMCSLSRAMPPMSKTTAIGSPAATSSSQASTSSWRARVSHRGRGALSTSERAVGQLARRRARGRGASRSSTSRSRRSPEIQHAGSSGPPVLSSSSADSVSRRTNCSWMPRLTAGAGVVLAGSRR